MSQPFDPDHWRSEARLGNHLACALLAIWERLEDIDLRLAALETAEEVDPDRARAIVAELGARWRIEREERKT